MSLPAVVARRRRRLAKIIGDGLVILQASEEAVASRDAHYHPYHPNSYFYYLTGCDEAQTAFLMSVKRGVIREAVFFCRPADARRARWEGEHLTPRKAALLYDIEAAPLGAFETRVERLAKEHRTLFTLTGDDQQLDAWIAGLVAHRRADNRRGGRGVATVSDLAVAVDDMRLTKDAAERAAIRRACALSCDGIRHAMRAAVTAKNECEVEAAIIHRYRRGGGHHAFPPIVAGGKNAGVLHYTANRAPLKAGELLLVDSGCQLNRYCGDITRSFPINGQWSAAQKAVVEIVLSAQTAAIRAVKPGACWPDIEDIASRELIAGLRSLKLCRGTTEAILKRESHRRFYMHRIGHWLGLDVHDVGAVELPNGRPLPFRPGMVITIEPGLYLPTDRDIPAPLRGIGVRIEDDLLITRRGNEILTAAAPKTPAAISEWMLG